MNIVNIQVIDGTRGSLDVGFILSGPGKRILVALTRRQSGMARTEAEETGDYRFCFDNTHSTISSKTVRSNNHRSFLYSAIIIKFIRRCILIF